MKKNNKNQYPKVVFENTETKDIPTKLTEKLQEYNIILEKK